LEGVDIVSNKQDRVRARTATDLERKYNFDKTFAEMLGIVNDSRDKVDSVESGLRDEIKNQETSLRRNTAELVATAKTELSGSIDEVVEAVKELSSEVKLKLDANAVNIAIEKEIQNGVSRVVTKTGFVFDHEGLDISKSGSEMSNQLNHTGMYVTRNGDEILTANNNGVNAVNLHAKTYLIIGSGDGRSRFEDYGINRTACFWVGG
jgi:hypothetical protein